MRSEKKCESLMIAGTEIGLSHVLLEGLIFKCINKMSIEKDFLSFNEACQYLGITKAGLYGLVHKKQIPYYKPTKQLYFLKSELIEWILNSKKGGAK